MGHLTLLQLNDLHGYLEPHPELVRTGGGVVVGLFGARLARRLSDKKGALNSVFAALIFVVAIYMLYRSADALGFIQPMFSDARSLLRLA